jgi:hypothetical protein
MQEKEELYTKGKGGGAKLQSLQQKRTPGGNLLF